MVTRMQFIRRLEIRRNRVKGRVRSFLTMRRVAKLDNICLNIGPGANWTKPAPNWLSVDVDPRIGDIVVNLCEFPGFPLKENIVSCIYASHVLEHVSMNRIQFLLNDCFRVLKPNGWMRIVLPDVEKSMREYLKGNREFQLFVRRRERARTWFGEEYTLFDCLKEDFISRSGQPHLLGKYALAHQNAFDYETLVKHLRIAGFDQTRIWRSGFRLSKCPDFSFEGDFESEANEDYRSLYVECQK